MDVEAELVAEERQGPVLIGNWQKYGRNALDWLVGHEIISRCGGLAILAPVNQSRRRPRSRSSMSFQAMAG
jgi:hypothetical protein